MVFPNTWVNLLEKQSKIWKSLITEPQKYMKLEQYSPTKWNEPHATTHMNLKNVM